MMLHKVHEQQDKYYNRKSENFKNITFLPIIYKSVTKHPKTLWESEKMWAEEKGNSNMFY